MSEQESEEQPRQERTDWAARLVHWFDSRLGLSRPLFRPVPEYAINPFYWLGALAVTAFVIQGITGVIMMLYYVPSPDAAFSSTQYIFNTVSYGRFLETVHLYTAYAMIMLAFMHMMRGYFVSVHKKPREAMWVVGMLMGFVTLGFGFTGYLLPWTVVSKSATDVGLGMIDALPPALASFITFLVVGAGGDATQLLRFYDLHVVVLPAVLLVLLAAKMYMFETHGISEPITSSSTLAKRRLIPVFPDASLYLFELAALFGAGMLIISIALPLNLPPQYSPELASQSTPQPDWYFLWIYQILKITAFEGGALPIALTLVTALFVLLVLLPFVDRGEKRRFADRRVYFALGLVFIAELLTLAYWGLITPGQEISNEQAALVLGGVALLVAGGTFLVHRLLYSKAPRVHIARSSLGPSQASVALVFTLLVGLGAIMIGSLLNSTVVLAMTGLSVSNIEFFGISLFGLGGVVLGTVFFLYRLDLVTGMVRRRKRILEYGWNGGD